MSAQASPGTSSQPSVFGHCKIAKITPYPHALYSLLLTPPPLSPPHTHTCVHAHRSAAPLGAVGAGARQRRVVRLAVRVARAVRGGGAARRGA
eukprot:190012-Chlamydomonas_euryale.AAC.1